MLALLPMQAAPWFPVWLTPLWILGVGIGIGLVVVAALFLVFAILSLIPGLGSLANNSKVANIVAGAISVGVAAVSLWWYMPQVQPDYQALMVVPFALMSIIVGFGLVYGIWRRTIVEFWAVLTEGVMGYLMGTAVVLMIVGLAVTPLVSDPRATLESIKQVNWKDSGEAKIVHTTEGNPQDIESDQAPFKNFLVPFDSRGVESVTIETDRTVVLGDAAEPADFRRSPVRIDPEVPFKWKRGDLFMPPLPGVASEGVWIQNREIDPAVLTFTLVSQPPVREASTIVITAFCIVMLVLSYLAFRQAAPRIAAIALATAKSEMAQPLYLVLMAMGGVAILLFTIIPFNTLGEDIKLLKDSGMTLIMVLGMIQAVWSAGTSVSEEIEGRTALTVLSKPVSRRSFLLGKYAGIMMSVLVLFAILGVLLMVVTAYKPLFEARENSTDQPVWQLAHSEMVSVVPGLVLYFMETMAIGAIGVALATRLAMLTNFLICFTIYVVGNLTSPLVQSSAGENELVGFIGRLIAVVVPNLNTFNIQSAVDVGNAVPAIYLAGALNYLFCFGILALMVSLLLFEDRDLA